MGLFTIMVVVVVVRVVAGGGNLGGGGEGTRSRKGNCILSEEDCQIHTCFKSIFLRITIEYRPT